MLDGSSAQGKSGCKIEGGEREVTDSTKPSPLVGEIGRVHDAYSHWIP